MEGVTCDTYTLTIEGTPQDWINANKLVHVHLGWTVNAQDFDVYIHKGDLNGPVVANSGNGITNGILGREDADLDPARPSVGTGTFAVHVVYWTATAAEQYTGTVSVENVPAAPAPTPTPTPTNEPPGTPRFYSYSFPNSQYPSAYNPGLMRAEARFGSECMEELRFRGHAVEAHPDWWEGACLYGAITRDPQSGVLQGGADPRGESYAIGY